MAEWLNGCRVDLNTIPDRKVARQTVFQQNWDEAHRKFKEKVAAREPVYIDTSEGHGYHGNNSKGSALKDGGTEEEGEATAEDSAGAGEKGSGGGVGEEDEITAHLRRTGALGTSAPAFPPQPMIPFEQAAARREMPTTTTTTTTTTATRRRSEMITKRSLVRIKREQRKK